jgi:hypothetical protein
VRVLSHHQLSHLTKEWLIAECDHQIVTERLGELHLQKGWRILVIAHAVVRALELGLPRIQRDSLTGKPIYNISLL